MENQLLQVLLIFYVKIRVESLFGLTSDFYIVGQSMSDRLNLLKNVQMENLINNY
jgi:hypothetical protein